MRPKSRKCGGSHQPVWAIRPVGGGAIIAPGPIPGAAHGRGAMTMRVSQITTHLRPENAYTIIKFLDQLREMLMQTYGDEIVALLQEASQPPGERMDD